MKGADKLYYAVWTIAGVIVFLFFAISYFSAADNYSVPAVQVKNIPIGAEKVGSIYEKNLTYGNFTYGPGENLEFVSDKANDLKIYESGLDAIWFSIDRVDSFEERKVIVSIRGINYSKLPVVYDHREELYVVPEDLRGLSWYENKGLTVTENAPWEITTKVTKNTVTTGVGVSAIAGFLAGLILAEIVKFIYGTFAFLFGLFNKKDKIKKPK